MDLPSNPASLATRFWLMEWDRGGFYRRGQHSLRNRVALLLESRGARIRAIGKKATVAGLQNQFLAGPTSASRRFAILPDPPNQCRIRRSSAVHAEGYVSGRNPSVVILFAPTYWPS